MVTPLNVPKYINLLKESNYIKTETEFLSKGFTEGFDIGYTGPENRQSHARNLPFREVGSPTKMWNKIMKEVKLQRVAGPFDTIPFDNYIQSPIGLVPKANNKTRLIFHLSYNFGNDQPDSVNACTPHEFCTVKYNDLDAAIRQCINVSRMAELLNDGDGSIYLGKMDLTSAFRILCMNRGSWRWLIFKAVDPEDGKTKYFVDKCLPFGASISCSHYQRFSNSIRHILEYRLNKIKGLPRNPHTKETTNYLDDFLFIAIAKWLCNLMIEQFLKLCSDLNLPVAEEKTEWGSTLIIFLGYTSRWR